MNRDRDIPPDETMWPCHAGSGECHAPDTKIRDDGDGGDAYFCERHAAEFDEMDRMLSERPELCAPLMEAILKFE